MVKCSITDKACFLHKVSSMHICPQKKAMTAKLYVSKFLFFPYFLIFLNLFSLFLNRSFKEIINRIFNVFIFKLNLCNFY